MATRRQPAQPEGLKTALSASHVNQLIHGDCLEVLRGLPDNSVDAIVTDPPAGISFMGKGWDSDKGGRDAWIVWLAEVMREALRVVKPGGHALVWALPRTSHWTAMALEDAGFEVRDCVTHLFGSGFPKSLDVGKALDKAAGAQREVVGTKIRLGDARVYPRNAQAGFAPSVKQGSITAPATDAARAWDGWGTALKPAAEFWWLCRKPLSESNVAANVLRWGTGALNIGASRVAAIDKAKFPSGVVSATEAVYGGGAGRYANRPRTTDNNPAGRWPPNLLLSHAADCLPDHCSLWCPVRELGEQSGTDKARPTWAGITGHQRAKRTKVRPFAHLYGSFSNSSECVTSVYDDAGTAARFFPTFRYVAKASRAERNRGCEGLPASNPLDYIGSGVDGRGRVDTTTPRSNSHPTVKPLALMSWLITLITPPGGVVLDPFAGSGSTLCAAKAGGWRYLGIEREAEYVAIAEARLAATSELSLGSATLIERPKPAKPKRERKPAKPTQPLWEMRA